MYRRIFFLGKKTKYQTWYILSKVRLLKSGSTIFANIAEWIKTIIILSWSVLFEVITFRFWSWLWTKTWWWVSFFSEATANLTSLILLWSCCPDMETESLSEELIFLMCLVLSCGRKLYIGCHAERNCHWNYCHYLLWVVLLSHLTCQHPCPSVFSRRVRSHHPLSKWKFSAPSQQSPPCYISRVSHFARWQDFKQISTTVVSLVVRDACGASQCHQYCKLRSCENKAPKCRFDDGQVCLIPFQFFFSPPDRGFPLISVK